MQSGIRRTRGGAPRPASALIADELIWVVSAIPSWTYENDRSETRAPYLRGLRDRALLLIGFALAARRSELADLDIEHLEFVAAGLLVTFPHSKTDQERKGQTVAVLRGARQCPVAALKAWLDAARIIEGPVFRALSKSDRVLPRGISGRQVARILQHRIDLAGIDEAGKRKFSGHSLRSGFLTTAANNRANIWKMAEISRHKDIKQLRTYVQKTELFEDHAGEGIL